MDDPPSQQIASKSTVPLSCYVCRGCFYQVRCRQLIVDLGCHTFKRLRSGTLTSISTGFPTSSSIQSSSLDHPSYFPTHNSRMAQYAGLEFDARRSGVVSDDGLHEVSPLSKGFDEKKSPYMDSTNALPQDRPQEKRICGFRRATFWLSITTALALALAIVAAAVGGYLAVKRGHSLDQLQQAEAYVSG